MFVPFSEMPDNARLWIYQSDRDLSDQEVVFIQQKLLEFTNGWKAHQEHLKASFQLLHKRFIILLVDEQHHEASGCSIDSSVAVIRALEQDYGINLFNRTDIAFEEEGELRSMPMMDFKNIIQADTIVFNNLIQTKGELKDSWKVKASDSWHAQLLA